MAHMGIFKIRMFWPRSFATVLLTAYGMASAQSASGSSTAIPSAAKEQAADRSSAARKAMERATSSKEGVKTERVADDGKAEYKVQRKAVERMESHKAGAAEGGELGPQPAVNPCKGALPPSWCRMPASHPAK